MPAAKSVGITALTIWHRLGRAALLVLGMSSLVM